MRLNDILSTIQRYPVARLVYSSLGFYARRRAGELPGLWFARALADAGATPAAVRKALRRMEQDGALVARRSGRHKLYRLSAYGRAAVDAGAEKLGMGNDPPWSGEWTLVYARFDADSRAARECVRTVLEVEGFAALGPGAFLHPRDRSTRLLRALREENVDHHVTVVRGRVHGRTPVELARHWDLEGLARRYRQYSERYEAVLSGDFDQRWAGRRGFALKFAVVLDYLAIAWSDPELPEALLPVGWPGSQARALASALNRRLLPHAVGHADRLLADLERSSPDLELAAPTPAEMTLS